MEASVVQEKNIVSNINLKDGRSLFTTNNGFTFWVKSKTGKVDEITEDQYNNSKKHRITKRNN